MVRSGRFLLLVVTVSLMVGCGKKEGPVATTDDVKAYVDEHGSVSSDDLKSTPLIDAPKK